MPHGPADPHRPSPFGAPPAGTPSAPPSAGPAPGTPPQPVPPSGDTPTSPLGPLTPRARGARGAALGLLVLAVGTVLAGALALLPPHSSVLMVVGALLGTLGAAAFAVLAIGHRPVRSLLVGGLLGLGLMACGLWGFTDVVLATAGTQARCEVTDVEHHGRTRGGGDKYGYHLRCPNGDTTVLRDESRRDPPPTVRVVYHPGGLVEPERPGDVTPVRDLAGMAACGAGCGVWALRGLRRRGAVPPQVPRTV